MTKLPESSPRAYWALLAAITVAGAWLRFRGVAWGLPDAAHPEYSFHPDEAFQMRLAAALAGGHPVGANFVYGGTLYFTTLQAYARLGAWLGGANPLADSLLLGRCVTALMSTLALPLAGAIARRVGGTTAGLAATAMLAVAPAHVFLSLSIRPDEGAALLALALLYCALRLLHADAMHRRWCVATGVALAVLLAWRLPHGVFAVSMLLATWFRDRPRGPRGISRWLFGADHLLIAAVALVGYAVLSPHSLFYPELFRSGVQELVAIQSSAFPDAIERGPALYQWGVTMLVEALGLGAYVVALLGIALALRDRDPPRLVLLGGVLAYFALTPLASWVVVRFTLPMLGPLAVLGALALTGPALGRAARVVAPVLLAAAVVPAALADAALLGALASRDARDRTSDWLSAELRPGTSVVTFRQFQYDRSFNPVVPKGLVDSPFPLFTGTDPALVAASPLGEVLVVSDDLYANIERLGARHPNDAQRRLGAVLAPGGPYELAATIVAPVRLLGIDFSGWFRSQDFRILHPTLRVYRRRATQATG